MANDKEEIKDIKENEETINKFYADNFRKLLKEGKITELKENTKVETNNKDDTAEEDGEDKNMTYEKCMMNELNKVDQFHNFPDFDNINKKCNKYNYYNFDINEGFNNGYFPMILLFILIILGIIYFYNIYIQDNEKRQCKIIFWLW